MGRNCLNGKVYDRGVELLLRAAKQGNAENGCADARLLLEDIENQD